MTQLNEVIFNWDTTCYFLRVPKKQITGGNNFKWLNEEQRDTFMMEHKVLELQYEKMSYIRLTGGVIRIAMNNDRFKSFAPNMVMFKNKNFGDKWIFADITADTYINKNVTEVSYAIDGLLTYYFDLDFSGKSYIARRTLFGGKDSDVFIENLPLEDLNVGQDYISTGTYTDYNNSDENYTTGQFYYLLMTKELCKEGNSHQIKAENITIRDVDGTERTISNGQNSVLYGYIMNYQCLNECLNRGLFQNDCDLVNSLQLIVLLPYGRDVFPQGITNIKNKISTATSPNFGEQLSALCELYDQEQFGWLHATKTVPATIFKGLCEKLNKAAKITSSEKPTSGIGQYLLKAPYSILQVYDYYNQPDNIRLSSLYLTDKPGEQYKALTDGIKIQKYATVGQAPNISYSIERYNNNTADENIGASIDEGGVGALQSINFYTLNGVFSLPIINDYTATFLQSNQNQINAQRANLTDTLQTTLTSAGASQQAQAQAAQISYNATINQAGNTYANQITNSIMNLNQSLTNQTALTTAKLQEQQAGALMNLFGIASTAASGIAGGNQTTAQIGANAVGAGVQALATTINTAAKRNVIQTEYLGQQAQAQTAQAVAANDASVSNLNAQIGAQANRQIAMANSSVSYANAIRTANLNYNTQIRSLNARLADLRNVPATVQSMGNYQSLANTLYNRDGITFTVKTLPDEVLARLATYWVYNGFMVNESESIQNILNKAEGEAGVYIQTVNANIDGQVPQEVIEQIKQVFDSGVTLWEPEHFKDYDMLYSV